MTKFCWFEYVSKPSDVAKAQAFYGELFNWKTKDVPMGGDTYQMIALGEHTIGGYSPQDGVPYTAWLAHLAVANVATTVGAITQRGGSVKMPAMAIPGMGTMAVVADPKGGVFALWQAEKSGPESGEFLGKPGSWCWNELFTDDVAASVKFYSEVGAFTSRKMDIPGMDYAVLSNGGKERGGVMKAPMPGIPQSWLPYLQVENAAHIVERAKRLGATVTSPPTTIPNVGTIAVFADPLGASFGILQP